MNEWLSITDVISLPGVQKSERRARDQAKRENWQSRPRAGRGGGLEYHITSLPPETRAALLSREVAVKPLVPSPQRAPVIGVKVQATLPAKKPDIRHATYDQAQTAFARAGLCRAIERMAAQGGMSVTAACAHLADLLAAHKADAALLEMAREANDKQRDGAVLSARSLLRWHKDFLIFGESALIPGRRAKDMGVPPWAGAFLSCYQVPSKPSVNDAYRMFKAGLNGADAPSVHQVRRFLDKLSPEAREQGRMGSRELKNIQPFRRRSIEKLVPNDVWSADGHTLDAEIAHPWYPNRMFRPEMTTYVDIKTRRIVGWSVEIAESALAVLDGLRMGIKTNGVPAILYVDNGMGYVNNAVKGVLERMGVTLTHALPYNSQAKGVVERLNQVWVRLAKRLPTYMGADMDAQAGNHIHKITRKALKTGVSHRAIVGWDAFVQMADEMVREYNAQVHSTLGCSPDEALQQAMDEGYAPQMVDGEVLDRLMLPSVERTTTRGEVRFANRLYFNNELKEHHGEKVLVHYDMRDARQVWVHDLEGRVICEAQKDGNSSSYMPDAFVDDAVRKREKAQVQRGIAQIERNTGAKVSGIEIEYQDNVLNGVFETVPEVMSLEDRARAQVQLDKLQAQKMEDVPAAGVLRDPIDLYLLNEREPEALNQRQRDYLAELMQKPSFIQRVEFLQARRAVGM